METIAPLARVLAEANGIDWQVIQGSGNSGLITEQDILVYLARVMSGEEDAPTTPVDPEPSPAELAAYASPEMLSRAGVDGDITDFLKNQSAAPAPAAPAPAAQRPAPAPEPEFELEDEPAQVDPVQADDDQAQADDALMVGEPEPEPEPVIAAEQPTPPIVTPVIPSLLSAEDAPAATPLAAEPITVRPVVPPAQTAPSGGLLGGLLSSLYRRNDKKEKDAPVPSVQAGAAQIAAAQPERVMPAPPEPAAQTETELAAPIYTAPEQPIPEAAAAQPAVPADVVPPISAEPAQAALSVPPAPELGEPITPEDKPQVAPAPTPQAAAPAQSAAWSGVYLRREIDLSALQDAREQLSELIGDVPISLMVARAAQRRLNLINVSSLAIANTQGQALSAEVGRDLRSDLAALSGAQPGDLTELLILDAGALDLDDLHYPHALTLSLGRVQHGKAALSLNGNLDVPEAAQFLAEVAALLSTPVKLLV